MTETLARRSALSEIGEESEGVCILGVSHTDVLPVLFG